MGHLSQSRGVGAQDSFRRAQGRGRMAGGPRRILRQTAPPLGHAGREEGEALLERRSGDRDNPRILGAFNETTPDWLSFFMFPFFTDRDGKFQLCALAESAFDPLARTTRFMLTEEAHHMFVGESGIARILQRTAGGMANDGPRDPAEVRRHGVIDLPTLQRYLNFHYSVTLDLFGAD